MSREFELLGNAESDGKPPRRAGRREFLPEFAEASGNPDLQTPVSPVEQGRLREFDWAKAFTVVRKRWRFAVSFAVIIFFSPRGR